MGTFSRFIAVFALALQVALGPAHLALEVCHGEVQLPAGDGAPCCDAEHCESAGEDTEPEGPTAEGDECSECFDLEIAGVDDPFEVAGSVDVSAQSEFAVAVVSERPSEPMGRVRYAQVSRGPPDSLTPTGLLPGVFPLRI
jgi:hypothetical protein